MKHFKLYSKNITIIIALIIAFTLFAYFLVISKNSDKKVLSRTGFYFDTIIEINLHDYSDIEDAQKTLDDCMLLCQKYENLFSKTINNSDIYKINSADGQSVKVSPETIELLEISIIYAKESNNIVSPALGNITALWDFDSPSFKIPTKDEIDYALMHSDYNDIIIDKNNCTVTLKDEKLSLDLGFIAKGYIADKLKDFIIDQNIPSAVINLGGNVLTIGTKPSNKPYIIGIKNPVNPSGAPICSVEIYGLKSIVSSGDYERNITINGQSYHHIISTKNGYPAESDLSQVTIINSSSVDGDALSTLCFILGSEEAKKYLSINHPEVEAIFVDHYGNIIK